MSNELAGKRIAFLVANAGVEQVELTSPCQAVKDAGGEPVLLAPEKEPVKTEKEKL
jgi:protease I